MNQTRYFEHRLRNGVHSALLLLALGALLAALGFALAGPTGVVFTLAAGSGAVLFTVFSPVSAVMRMLGGRPLPPRAAPALYEMVHQLASRAGLAHVPTLYLGNAATPNAAATGDRDHAGIFLTRGLLAQLTRDELSGVLAHEIAHIRHNDIFTMQAAAVFARLTAALSTIGQLAVLITLPLWLLSDISVPFWMLLLMVFAPVLSTLLTLALSRSREFDADATAATLLGTPVPLMRALSRIERMKPQPWPWQRALEGAPWAQSHPATGTRLKRLADMAARQTSASRDRPGPLHSPVW